MKYTGRYNVKKLQKREDLRQQKPQPQSVTPYPCTIDTKKGRITSRLHL